MIDPEGKGERARRIRERSGVPRHIVAQRIDVSLRTLTRWENGESPPPDDLLDRVEWALGLRAHSGLSGFSTYELAQELERRLRG